MHNVHLKLLTDNFCCIFTVLENANFNFWFSSFLWIQTFLGFGITIFWKSAGFLSTVDWKPPIRLMSSSMMNIEWPNLGTSGRVGIGNHREPVTQANRVGEMLPGGLIIEKKTFPAVTIYVVKLQNLFFCNNLRVFKIEFNQEENVVIYNLKTGLKYRTVLLLCFEMFSSVNKNAVRGNSNHCMVSESNHHFHFRNPTAPLENDVTQSWIIFGKNTSIGHFRFGPLSTHLDRSGIPTSENKKPKFWIRSSETR